MSTNIDGHCSGRIREYATRLYVLAGRAPVIAAGGLVAAGIIVWGGFNTAMEATNTMPFCISCHVMRSTVYEEYKHSVHFTNPSGVQAGCPDCHVPREWIPKMIRKIQASKELYHWAMGTISAPEKFEARRPELAARVWETMKSSDSRECRNCHSFSTMTTKDQGRFAARSHERAQTSGATCIDCHKGISHHLPKPLPDVTQGSKSVDIEYAEEINTTCAPCHGRQGQGTADGVYPRLAGQDERYLARQIAHFKSRERLNIPMLPYATERELPDDDVRTITAYLSSIKLQTKMSPESEGTTDALALLKQSKASLNIPLFPGDAGSGERLYKKECAACHGRDGYGSSHHGAPQLAGQHSLYLKRQIEDFRKAARRHADPADVEIFKSFTDDEIAGILSYVSTLDDG